MVWLATQIVGYDNPATEAFAALSSAGPVLGYFRFPVLLHVAEPMSYLLTGLPSCT